MIFYFALSYMYRTSGSRTHNLRGAFRISPVFRALQDIKKTVLIQGALYPLPAKKPVKILELRGIEYVEF